ncbi:hypothetical protein L3X38_032632 [Prunus dulcis]|uniref:Uncharacterized protein n=1 Tax=Prunus dulcis TaxID=3755 RepID=A0AAD4YW36_PRUDU|nr:hypothetical protein L3X38_032632 [Prunus dulcis]
MVGSKSTRSKTAATKKLAIDPNYQDGMASSHPPALLPLSRIEPQSCDSLSCPVSESTIPAHHTVPPLDHLTAASEPTVEPVAQPHGHLARAP